MILSKNNYLSTNFTNKIPTTIAVILSFVSFVLSYIESCLNLDVLHWGMIYASASDLNNGLIPFKQTYEIYGILTAVINSIFIKFMDGAIVSVGISTGFFYSLSILLSYFVWKKIMGPWLAITATGILFLIHPYIIYPWPNYFSYTFQLIAILLVIGNSLTWRLMLFSGISLGLALLCRHTAIISSLIPFYIFFYIQYLSQKNDGRILSNRVNSKNFIFFNIGLFIILGGFIIYIWANSLLKDWYIQTVVVNEILLETVSVRDGWHNNLDVFINFIKNIIFIDSGDLRTFLFTIVAIGNLLLLIIFLFFKNKFVKIFTNNSSIILFLASFSMFGFSQSIHIYEIFRLINAASIGIGLSVFLIYKGLYFTEKNRNIVFFSLMLALFMPLGATAIFTESSSVVFPWDKNILFNERKLPSTNIPVFKHKILPDNILQHYEERNKVLQSYTCKIDYIINVTTDFTIPYLVTEYKKEQRESGRIRHHRSDILFPDEIDKWKHNILTNNAIIIVNNHSIPDNYRVVYEYDFQNIQQNYPPWNPKIIKIAVPISKLTPCN